MKEAVERVSAAWAALRGWSVIRGVSVTYGEVDVHRRDLHLSGDAAISQAQIWTQGPVIFRGKVDTRDNKGTALAASESNPAGWR